MRVQRFKLALIRIPLWILALSETPLRECSNEGYYKQAMVIILL